MQFFKIKRLQYETDTWKRLLFFLMEETVQLKNLLTEILKEDFHNNCLPELEDFQTRFIKQDERIQLLRHEVAEFDRLLQREIIEDGQLKKAVDRKINQLRNNITNAEQEFNQLQAAFNSYLLEKS
ncbi:MAG: hypothetical protein JNM19_11150 [Chitinophagaceae bacterium]|nr:hypothetical protein [Chitinophagaceae bacterium]